MKFLKLDKKKGSGGPSIKSRYAYLIYVDDIAYLPTANEKGVRLEGDILLKEDCTMMPLYLTSSSQEFSYDILGDDDEKSYLVKFSGNHPGTELEALEFAKNMIEQPFLVMIPSCNESEPWKLLGELTNPLIFTSSHKGGSDSSKFTFNFEQRIGSEFIYFSYGGVEVPSDGGGGVQPPDGGFDPTKWARIDASNIDPYISQWRTKLGVNAQDRILTIGAVTATSNKVNLALPPELKNEVVIDRINHLRTVAQEFPFTAVTTGIKVLIVEALPDADVFHLVEGIEGPETTEPAYTGLFIARLLATSTGVVVETEDVGYKYTADDAWRQFTIKSTPLIISISNYSASSFRFLTDQVSPVFGGIVTKLGKKTWDGKRYYLRNLSPKNIALTPTVIPEVGQAKGITFASSSVLKAGGWAIIVIENGKFEVFEMGGASFPELGNNGDLLQKDANLPVGVKWVSSTSLGQNIFNTNLTLADNRTQNLNGKTLYFTGSVTSKFKLDYLFLVAKTADSIPDKIWYDGVSVWLNPSTGIPKRVSTGTVFVYTPTGNFTISAVKLAMESAGFNFNDSHTIVNLGSNSYTCSIDCGSTYSNRLFTIGKRGSGSISFTSTRTLNSGADAVTIMNGNEGSMAKVDFGTSIDFLTIRNL